MNIIDVDEKNFESEVLKSQIPVIVDVWAEWCGPCRFYTPIIEEVSKDYEGRVKFVKLNSDYNSSIAAKYNIMAIPTTLLIKNGVLKAVNVGAVPKETLRRWIDSNLKAIDRL
ncbi:MAG: thioredoxin [Candidatus Micrarchaeaceae archaeon]